MNTSAFLANFPGQLRHWSFHCILNSLPSFTIALWALGLWQSRFAMAAMASAIVTFILIYATMTSFEGPMSDEKHVLARAFKVGTKIRAVISILNLLLAFTPFLMLTPDFWCGFMATGIVDQVLQITGNQPVFRNLNAGEIGFFPIYLATMVEGCILSGILFFISFIAVIHLQAKDRRRFFNRPATR
jgi:hypothetical protein